MAPKWNQWKKIAEDATAKIEKLEIDLKSANANVEANASTMTTYHEKASTILNLILELQDVQLIIYFFFQFNDFYIHKQTITGGAGGAEVEGTIEIMMDRSINNLLGLRQVQIIQTFECKLNYQTLKIPFRK